MTQLYDQTRPSLGHAAAIALGLAAFGLYVGVAAVASLFAPLAFPLFLAPFALLIFIAAPRGRAAARKFVWPLMLAATMLMPLWPTFLHVALGPLPLLTPPRAIFYILSALWLYDMAVSPWRRGQLLVKFRRSPWLTGAVVLFFALNALSVPLAEGTVVAARAFFRQIMILALPFLIFLTYVNRPRELKSLVVALVIGAGVAGAIAIGEYATQTLMIAKLAPLIMAEGQWIEMAQSVKSRDGVFRAQATHTHPISLGEYLTFCAPLALGLALSMRGSGRWGFALAAVVILGGILATNSRGALVALPVGIGVLGAIFTIRVLSQPRRARFRPLIGLAVLSMIAVSPVIMFGAHALITGDAGTSAARSSQARIEQIEMAWPKILKRPVLGYGTGRSTRIVGYYGRALSLDNYYLSLAVDLGFPGPLAFIAFMAIAMRRTSSAIASAPLSCKWVLIGLTAALASFLVSRMIISQTQNLNLLFPLIGAIAATQFAGARRMPASRFQGRRPASRAWESDLYTN